MSNWTVMVYILCFCNASFMLARNSPPMGATKYESGFKRDVFGMNRACGEDSSAQCDSVPLELWNTNVLKSLESTLQDSSCRLAVFTLMSQIPSIRKKKKKRWTPRKKEGLTITDFFLYYLSDLL